MDTLQISKFTELAVMFDTFKFIPRLSTKRIPIDVKESVATHIYEMIYLGYLGYYSMTEEDQSKFDLLKIIKLILWHEADETITNDIPYPAKKNLKLQGEADALHKMKDMVYNVYNDLIPNEIRVKDNDIVEETFDRVESSPEKKFVKFLDYVNLYLNSIMLCNRGYAMQTVVDECKALTSKHEYYSICPLVRELIENPHKFITKEYN